MITILFDRNLSRLKSAGALVTTLTVDNPAEWLTGESTSVNQRSAMKVSTVNRCVEVISNSVAKYPIYVMERATRKHLDDHRLQFIYNGRANEAMTLFDYEKLMQCSRLLVGNAAAWIYRSPSTGWPREFIPLPYDHMTPHVDSSGHLWYFFTHPRTGQTTKLHPADVIHYKAYSEDGIEGISILSRAVDVIATARAAQRYELSIYKNGGRPSGVLQTDTDLTTGNNAGSKDKIRAEWEKVHNGPDNAFRVAVLDLGLKYQSISMSNADAQFVESKTVSVEDICRFFGVPLNKVFAGKQAYDSNEANSIEYVQDTIQPIVTACEQEDSYKLLLPSEIGKLRVRRNMDADLRGDSASRIEYYKGMREIGAYSVNDILAKEDLPPVPGGDARYASLNYIPLNRFDELSVARNTDSNSNQKEV